MSSPTTEKFKTKNNRNKRIHNVVDKYFIFYKHSMFTVLLILPFVISIDFPNEEH